MRLVIIGEGENGLSKVVDVKPLPENGEQGVMSLWATDQSPPEVPTPRRVGGASRAELRGGSAGEHAGMCPGPGGSRWYRAVFEPGHVSGKHRTDTIDYDIILSGEVTLILEDGEIVLHPGDAAVIPGAVHNWRAGPDGCTLSVVFLGLTPVK